MKVHYSVEKVCSESLYEAEVTGGDIDWLTAQECAEDYYHNHDGWESSWPQLVYLRESEDGPIVAAFNVDMEAVPQFYAYETEVSS